MVCLLIFSTAAFCEDQPRFENSLFRITVDPSNGGRISSLILKSDGTEWILPGNRGLLMDHVTQQNWPGELLDRKYEYALETTPTGDPAIRLWTTIDGGNEESISGIKLEKTIIFRQNRPVIDVTYKLSNPTSESKNPGLWIQNILSPGGTDEGKFSYRPTTIGPLALKYPDEAYKPENESRFDPTAGWLAALNPQKQMGMLFLMDYNYLKCLYCAQYAYTHEWWYEPVLLPPGKTFETKVTIWPVFGISSVEHASKNVVCQMDFQKNGSDIAAKLTCIPGPEAADNADISTKIKLQSYPDRKELKSIDSIDKISLSSPLKMQIRSLNVPEKTNVILNTSMAFSTNTESFEMYKPGLAILFSETTYLQQRPKRIRERFKPENLVVSKNLQPRILHLRGLFSDKYRLNKSAETFNAQVVEGSYRRGTFGASISNLPMNYTTLMSYNIIIINHIPMDGLTDDSWEMLSDYVNHGGILFIMGGPMCSIGSSEVSEYALKLLPVRIDSLWKTIRAKKAVSLGKAGRWQYRIQTSQMSSNSKIVIGSKANPVLITKKYGRGMVALYTPLPLTDGKLTNSFWDSTSYPAWFANVLQKLLKQTGQKVGIK